MMRATLSVGTRLSISCALRSKFSTGSVTPGISDSTVIIANKEESPISPRAIRYRFMNIARSSRTYIANANKGYTARYKIVLKFTIPIPLHKSRPSGFG